MSRSKLIQVELKLNLLFLLERKMDILIFILTTLCLGILGSIPTVVVRRLLTTNGMVYEEPVQVFAVGIAGMFFIRLVLFPELPAGFHLAVLAICLPLAIRKVALWTRKNGRRNK